MNILKTSYKIMNVLKHVKQSQIYLTCHKIINILKAFSTVFFTHLIAQVFRSLKTQRLRVRIPPEA